MSVNLEALHQKALVEYENKNLDEALKIYEEIIRLCPNDEVALSCTMDIYLEKDDKFNYYLSRANVNIAQNKLEYAISDTKKAIELDVDNLDARRKLARLYKVDNKILKSIDEFLRLLELDSKQIDAYFELVDLYMKEDSIDSAISIAKQGLAQFPDDINLKNMLAQLYFKANDFKSALDVVQDNFFKIKILLQDEQNEAAKSEIDKLNYNKLDDIQKRSYHILKAQYLYNINEFEASLAEIDSYTKLASPDAVSFQMKALIYEGLNNDFEASANWGFCYRLQGKFDDAMVEFTNAYKINPNDKTVLIELANLYERNKEKYVAMEFWQKVYDIDKDSYAKEVLAEFYYSEGNFEKAEEYGKKLDKKDVEKQQELENYTGLIDKIMNFFTKNK